MMLRVSHLCSALAAVATISLAGCGGGSSGTVAGAVTPSSASNTVQRSAATAVVTASTLGVTATTPHIFAWTNPSQQKTPVSIKAFTDQGNELELAGTFPNVLNPFALTYDSHAHSIYILNYLGPVNAYDTQGNQRKLLGSFAHLPPSPWLLMYNPHNNWIYVLGQGPLDATPSIKAYDEQGFEQKLAGGFPNLGDFGDTLMYDSHNGLIYYGGDKPPNYTKFVAAYDEQGNPKTLSGGFPNIGGPRSMTYDGHNGLIYVADSSTTHTTILAYDEQGNEQKLSPGFPSDMPLLDDVAYDANDGFLYIETTDPRVHYSERTLTAWSEQGAQQTLPGRFDDPRTFFDKFVIAQ